MDKIIGKMRVTYKLEWNTEIDIYEDINNPEQYAKEVSSERFKDSEDFEQIKILDISMILKGQ